MKTVSDLARKPGLSINLLTFLFLLPSLTPFTNVDAEARIESDDFEILDDLSDILSERENIINTNTIGSLAEPKINNIDKKRIEKRK